MAAAEAAAAAGVAAGDGADWTAAGRADGLARAALASSRSFISFAMTRHAASC